MALIFFLFFRNAAISIVEPVIVFEEKDRGWRMLVSFFVQNGTMNSVNILPDDYSLSAHLYYENGTVYGADWGQVSCTTYFPTSSNVVPRRLNIEAKSKRGLSFFHKENDAEFPPIGTARLVLLYKCLHPSTNSIDNVVNGIKYGPHIVTILHEKGQTGRVARIVLGGSGSAESSD
jgi:hypothetical protein